MGGRPPSNERLQLVGPSPGSVDLVYPLASGIGASSHPVSGAGS